MGVTNNVSFCLSFYRKTQKFARTVTQTPFSLSSSADRLDDGSLFISWIVDFSTCRDMYVYRHVLYIPFLCLKPPICNIFCIVFSQLSVSSEFCSISLPLIVFTHEALTHTDAHTHTHTDAHTTEASGGASSEFVHPQHQRYESK